MTQNKIILTGLIIIVLISLFFFLEREDKTITNYPPKNNTIVAFGDSLIEGVGSSTGNDFVSIVGENIDREIINKGVSGDTTESALARIDGVLLLEPGIVIVLLGGNDFLHRISQKETFQNLETIITKLQQSGSLVVLLGVRGGLITDSYKNGYDNLAEKYHTIYITNVLKDIITKRDLMSDGIHPNDKGYEIIAERVTPVLEKILK